jgi:transcription-repair coupling factor (superfamily II helicase)
VGLSLYLGMLEEAVRALRSGQQPVLDRPLAATTDVELHVPALLPEAQVPDVHLRLSLYQRIAAADATALEDMQAELVDRFGPLPGPASNLLAIAALRLRARELGIRRLELTAQGGSVAFEEQNRVEPAAVIALIQKQAKEFRLEGPLRLRVTRPLPTPHERFAYADRLLKALSPKQESAGRRK